MLILEQQQQRQTLILQQTRINKILQSNAAEVQAKSQNKIHCKGAENYRARHTNYSAITRQNWAYYSVKLKKYSVSTSGIIYCKYH